MTIYSEMLRLALAEDAASNNADRPIAGLVDELLLRRTRLILTAGQSPTGRVADQISDALSYDVTLIRLCDRLAIEHDFSAEDATTNARRRLEEALGHRLPSVAAALTSTLDDAVPTRSEPDEPRRAKSIQLERQERPNDHRHHN